MFDETNTHRKSQKPSAALILARVLAGTIPVVSAEGILIINLKGAKQMGVTIPKDLLDQAAQIIQ